MDHSDGGSTQTFLHRGHNYALVIAVLVVAFVLLQSPRPWLGCDEAAWLTSVIKALNGKVIGQEAPLAKGPYLLAWHTAVYAALGPNVMALKIVGMLWSLLTGIVICLLAHRFAGKRGVIATAVLYIAATADPAMRDSVYAETILMLPVAAAVWLVIRGLDRRSWWHIVAGGVLSGIAVLTKQTAFLSVVALAGAIFIIGRRSGLKTGVRRCGAFIVGAVVAAVPWIAYILVYHRPAEAADGMVGSAVQYLGRLDLHAVIANLGWASVHVLPRYTIVIIASIGGLVLLLRSWRRGDRPGELASLSKNREWEIVAVTASLWYLASLASVGATLRFAAHYFNQLAAPAALLGGLWIARAWFRGNIRRRTSGALNIPVLVAVTQIVVIMALVPEHVGRWHYAIATVREGSIWQEAGEYIRTHTRPGDTVFVWGDDNEVAYWARRELSARNPWITNRILGFTHIGPLYAARERQEIEWERLQRHLQENQPACFVVASGIQTTPPEVRENFGTDDLPRLKEILHDSYERDKTVAGFEIWWRKEPPR